MSTNHTLDLHDALFRTLAADPGFRAATADEGIYDLEAKHDAPFPYVVVETASDTPIPMSGGDAHECFVRFAIHSDRRDRRDLLSVLHAMRQALAEFTIDGYVVARVTLTPLAVLRDPQSTNGRPRVSMSVGARIVLRAV